MYEREDIQRYLETRVARPSSAGVILENSNGEALLLKAHYKPYWSFPGGWIDDDQTPTQAALRELAEETGVQLKPEDVEFAYVVTRTSSTMLTYQFMFRATQPFDDAGTIKLQENEIAQWHFVSKETVMADQENYGGAVLVWARSETSGYAEQHIDTV